MYSRHVIGRPSPIVLPMQDIFKFGARGVPTTPHRGEIKKPFCNILAIKQFRIGLFNGSIYDFFPIRLYYTLATSTIAKSTKKIEEEGGGC